MSPGEPITRLPAGTSSESVVTLPTRDTEGNQTGVIINKIEGILGSILDSIVNDEDYTSISYRRKTAGPRHVDNLQAYPPGQAASHSTSSKAEIKFPSKANISEARKFAALVRILGLSLNALVSGKVITKRSIYYQNIELFKNQRVVDGLVDEIAHMLTVTRDSLNIVAAAKGLIAGPISLVMHNGSIISCRTSHGSGSLIPPPRLIRQIDFGPARWVLVMEKEATFRTLCASEYYDKSLAGPGILVTAKGFPDLTTRLLLNTIHAVRPHLPLFALVDFDPDGISILRTYMYGSKALGHEENASVPQLRWLGIRSGDLSSFGGCAADRRGKSSSSEQAPSSSSQDSLAFSFDGSGGHPDETWKPFTNAPTGSQSGDVSLRSHTETRDSAEVIMPLTSRDRKIAVNILKNVCSRETLGLDDMEQRQELQLMLVLNIKAEIQAVDDSGDMTDWLDMRLGI